MTEFIVRIIALERSPLRTIAQQVFNARNERHAEQIACAWAFALYGGHPENYDASAITLRAWRRSRAFRGAFA
jgi:hypothetical protein